MKNKSLTKILLMLLSGLCLVSCGNKNPVDPDPEPTPTPEPQPEPEPTPTPEPKPEEEVILTKEEAYELTTAQINKVLDSISNENKTFKVTSNFHMDMNAVSTYIDEGSLVNQSQIGESNRLQNILFNNVKLFNTVHESTKGHISMSVNGKAMFDNDYDMINDSFKTFKATETNLFALSSYTAKSTGESDYTNNDYYNHENNGLEMLNGSINDGISKIFLGYMYFSEERIKEYEEGNTVTVTYSTKGDEYTQKLTTVNKYSYGDEIQTTLTITANKNNFLDSFESKYEEKTYDLTKKCIGTQTTILSISLATLEEISYLDEQVNKISETNEYPQGYNESYIDNIFPLEGIFNI